MKRTIDDNIKLNGKQQQVKLVEDTVKNDTFFPKGVHIDDMDRSVRDNFKEKFEIVSQGKAIPFLDIFSIQRFSEFMKTWQNVDETNTINLPFIIMVREKAEKGTNLGGTFNIASDITFPVWKRNTVRNGRATVDFYQIAQPVNIDIDYTVHLFTSHQREVNMMDEMMLHAFKSAQYYVLVNGHHMPLFLESMDDDSQVGDLEKRKYYHKKYTLKLKGYLLREEDFRKLPSIDRIILKTHASYESNAYCEVKEVDFKCDLCLNYKFNRKSPNSQTYRIPMRLEFYYDNQNPVNDYSYFLNGNLVTLPFIAEKGDELTVSHNLHKQNIINITVCAKKLD